MLYCDLSFGKSMYKVDNIISHLSSKDRVAENLIDAIKNGDIKGGQRIDQAAIAKREKVSLSTVREALSIIETKGFVEWIPGQGAFCKIYTISCFEKFMQIRRELEVLAAKEAAKNASDLEIDALREIAERLKYLVDKDTDKDEIFAEHIRFHQFLAKISGNEYLEKIITENHLISNSLSAIIEVFEAKGLTIRDFTGIKMEYADHTKLVRIIASRNPEDIEVAMRSHLTIIIDSELRKKYGDEPLF